MNTGGGSSVRGSSPDSGEGDHEVDHGRIGDVQRLGPFVRIRHGGRPRRSRARFFGSREIGTRKAEAGEQLLGERIAFRVNGRLVERLGAVADAEKPGALLKPFVGHAGERFQLFPRGKRAVRQSMRDDFAGDELIESRHVPEQG